MCRDHCDRSQVDRIEDLHFANLATARIGQVGLFIVHREGAQALGIRGYVTNSVYDPHVADVVYIDPLF